MGKQQELAGELNKVTEQLKKIGTESAKTLDAVKKLEEQIANQEVSAELQKAFDDLKAQVQIVDELVPDATPTEPPVEGL